MVLSEVQKFCRSNIYTIEKNSHFDYLEGEYDPVVLIHLKAQYIKIMLSMDYHLFHKGYRWSPIVKLGHQVLKNISPVRFYLSSSPLYLRLISDNRWELRINNYRTTLATLDQVFDEKQIYIRKYQLLLYQKSTNSYGTASYHYQKSSSIIETSIIKGKRINNGDNYY